MNKTQFAAPINYVRNLNLNFRAPVAAGLATLLIVGCASNKAPTFSDNVAKEGAQYNAISKKWSTGKELVAKGEKRIKKGRKQISDGNENISEGEKLIRRGNQMIRDSEQEYKLKQELSAPASS